MKVMYDRVAGDRRAQGHDQGRDPVPGEKPWTRKTGILEYRTFYGVLQEMGRELRRRGVTHVVMEASGVYTEPGVYQKLGSLAGVQQCCQHIIRRCRAVAGLGPRHAPPREWTPRFITHTSAKVESSATLLCPEILMPGRKYHGDRELFAYDLYSSTFTARRPDGSPLFTEKFAIEPALHPVRATGIMEDFDVIGNVLVITPEPNADRILDLVGAVPAFGPTWASGAGRLPNHAGVVYKVLGRRRQDVQAKIRGSGRSPAERCSA